MPGPGAGAAATRARLAGGGHEACRTHRRGVAPLLADLAADTSQKATLERAATRTPSPPPAVSVEMGRARLGPMTAELGAPKTLGMRSGEGRHGAATAVLFGCTR